MGADYCGQAKFNEEECYLNSENLNDENKKTLSAWKIQKNWKMFETLKKKKTQKLCDSINLLNEKAYLEHEFATLEQMQMQVGSKVIETEKKLHKFNLYPELHFFKFSKCREPIKLNDESIYHGYWNMEGQKHGYGILIRKDGSKYEGFFENDKLQGRGRFIDSQASFYYEGTNKLNLGFWKNNQANGQGQYFLFDGTKYTGFWKDDLQDGEGEEIFPDGTIYHGHFHKGKKNGKGLVKWKDGSVFEGDFFNSTIHGYGVYAWSDGRVYKGYWQNGKMHGKGKFTWPDGKYYEGEYKHDKKDGAGKYFWNGKVYEGTWLNGKQHGFGSVYYGTVLFLQGLWRFGKLIKKDFEKPLDTFSRDKVDTRGDDIQDDYHSEKAFVRTETLKDHVKSKTNLNNEENINLKTSDTLMRNKTYNYSNSKRALTNI